MKSYIFATFMALVNSAVFDSASKCITIRGNKYEEEKLQSNVPDAYQLAIDYNTNTLFFSYSVTTNQVTQIAYFNLNTNEYGLVTGVSAGFANAVNNISHEVYMGEDDGLYKFDYNTKSATKLNISMNLNIWQMFYKDGLFFITYPDNRAFLYKNNKVVEIPELNYSVTEIGVLNNGNYVLANDSGIFTYNKVLKTVIKVGDFLVNAITADIAGNLYFSCPDAIYYLDEKKFILENLLKSDPIFGVAIESNGNIIYSNRDSIIRLKPTNKMC